MAWRPQIALTAALVLMAGCPVQVSRLPPEDLSQGWPADPTHTLVGRDVVARVADFRGGRSGYFRTNVDVFPAGAVLRGAWAKRLGTREICEGPLDVVHHVDPQHYELLWPGREGSRCQPAPPAARTSTTLWLGPVCLRDACQTFRIDGPD